MRGGPWRRLALAVGAILFAAPAAAAEPATRTLGVIPFYAPERMWTLYSPLVEHLGRATGEPWKLALRGDHAAVIDDLCFGRVDVALLGPVPLGRANRRCGATPFLVALGANGAPDYRSVLLTADPAITSVAGLRGKRIGFFKGSTAAHVAPAQLLSEAGLPPGSYTAVFLESQDRLMSALLAGKIQAAGVKSALHKRFEREPGLRVLATSAPLPNFAFAALPSFGRQARERFAGALLRLRPRERPADAETVKSWDDEVKNGFVEPAPGYLPAVLSLQGVTEKILHDAP